MEEVFRALGDPFRRALLDRLFERDGQTLSELCEDTSLTRFGVMKHLRVLEEAGLVITRKVGREKFHYLNPVPIRQVHDRWISKFSEPWVGGLSDIKRTLEEQVNKPSHVYQVYIRTSPEQLWNAITNGEMTHRYFHATRITSTWDKGAPLSYVGDDGKDAVTGIVVEYNPPQRLVFDWTSHWGPEFDADPPSRVTFDIEPMGEVCKLTLTHDKFEGETQTYSSISQGWAPILNSLKSLLETGEPLPL